MTKIVLFTIVSATILWVSWPSLRDPRSHGFYRFFAFESILILVLCVLGAWFDEPFSLRQIASWSLFLSSVVLAAHGFYLLKTVGRPREGFESTTTLVVRGAYRYIRHPLYASLLLFALGALLKAPSALSGVVSIAVLVFLGATAKVEERENLQKFGDDYARYMQCTKMLIPGIF
jgi:protein-S-isoprenylcysteine O-methyltransferase Ste14